MCRTLTALLAAVTIALTGCGGPYHRTARGDPAGVPVRLEVDISRNFVRDLPNRGPGGREVVVYSNGYYSGWWGGWGHYGACPPGYRYRYDPFWYSDVYWTGPAPTAVYLLAGDGPGQARLLRTELDYGKNLIDLPITPGRRVTLTVQAYGGYEGWEEIGSFTVANQPGQVVLIDLQEHAPHLRVINPDGTTVEQAPPTQQAPPAPAATAPAVPPAAAEQTPSVTNQP